MGPSTPKSAARTNTQGFPTSIQLALMPSKSSSTLPVGRSLPVLEPAGSTNASSIFAPVPATPAMEKDPSVTASPSRTWNLDLMSLFVFVLKIRTCVSPSNFTDTIPQSTANGPTALDILPQLLE